VNASVTQWARFSKVAVFVFAFIKALLLLWFCIMMVVVFSSFFFVRFLIVKVIK